MTNYLRQHRPLPSVDSDLCPDYDSVVGSSSAITTGSTRASQNPHWRSFEDPIAPLSITPRPCHEYYLYTYNLITKGTPMQFFVSVESSSGRPIPGKYTFRLSFKLNGVERDLCEPQVRQLQADPRKLEFVVFVFPGKSSVPADSLYSLRVWLRVNSIDHRIFADDELWVGRDLDFNSIAEASYTRLQTSQPKEQKYHGYIGKALVTFTCRWDNVRDNLYHYTLDYESGGVGANIFEDLPLRVDDPNTIKFLIYSVPITSTPPGSTHRLRVWLKSLITLSPNNPASLSFNDTYIYQRIWKTDAFKIGARLDFGAMGSRSVIGFANGQVQTIVTHRSLPSWTKRSG